MICKILYRTLSVGAFLIAGLVSVAPVSAQVIPASRVIMTQVNNSDRVALNSSLSRSVVRAADLGAVDSSLPARHVTMVLQRSAERQAALDQYLSDVQNPKSSEYRHWLTPAQFGARFGAAADDVQAIGAWLQSQGLKIERTSPAANMITFTGTVGQMEAAFSTSIHSLSIAGEKHMANISVPQVPRALVPAVKDVVGLDDIHPRSTLQKGAPAKFNLTTHRIEPNLTLFDNAGNPYLYVNPADAAVIYDTPNANLNTAYKGTTYDGTGLTLGVVGDSDVDLTPVQNYRLAFLGETSSNVNLPSVVVDGVDPGTNNDEVEAWLDLEILGGLAPKAKINYYESGDSDISSGLFNAIERAINDNQVNVLSISYGECEALAGTSTADFMAEIFQQASAQGITVAVSSGDAGSAGCDADTVSTAVGGLGVNALGSSPYNVSVGGTDYDVLGSSFNTYVQSANSGSAPYYATALSYIPERPWNNSTNANGALADNSPLISGNTGTTDIDAGGGGKSLYFTKPPFQTALTPADGARDVPDVSFLAANGLYGALWVLCEDEIAGADCATTDGQFTSSTTFEGAGGTSAATPAFAGMLALVSQATGSRLGNVNNVLYNLAASKYGTVFHDITMGNNAVVCTTGSPDCGTNGFETGYDAGVGYDLASGLGSVDAAQMLSNWSSGVGISSNTSLTINGATSPVSVAHGTSLNFGVTVDPATATGSAGLVTTGTVSAGTPTLNGQAYTIAIDSGTGSGTYNGLPGGQYTVYATYGGDTKTAASQSNAISVNISPETSSTMLWVNAYTPAEVTISNLNAIPYGSYIFAESSVYGTAEGYDASLGYATGTMTVLDGGKSIGTSPITSGNFASFPAIAAGAYPYDVGTHMLTATYPGDASYKANTSSVVSFTVLQGATSSVLYPATTTLYSNTSDNIEVDITTSSLAKSPTGTITLTANGRTLGTTSSLTQVHSLNGYALSYAIFSVQGSQLINGTNTLTATYSGDSNYAGSTGTTNVSVSQVNFSLRTSPISTIAGSTTGNTATVTANSIGGFAGVVDLSCAVTSAPSNATSPITCSIPMQIDMTGTSPATAVLTVNSTTNTTAGAYVVTITGIDAATKKIMASTTSAVTVMSTPGITLANSSVITLAAGATTGNTSTLTLAGANGYAGSVALACAVTSAPASAVSPVTCGISPALLSLSGTAAGTATLSISSTARTSSAVRPHDLLRGVGGTFLAFGVLLILPSRHRRRLGGLCAVLVLLSLGSLVGCGGNGSGKSGSGTTSTAQTGTTAGAYVVTVTATPAGAAAQTTIVNVTVN